MASRDTKLNIIIDAQDKASGTFKSFERNLERSNGSLGSVAKFAAGATAAFYTLKTAFDGVKAFAGTGIDIAAQLETAEIGLKTLLGSADKAAATVARLKIEAARTPFELPGLTQATQLLTSVTKDGDKSIDILLNVGEALSAMGKGQAELDRLIVNLQQIAATGKAATIDIKQFAFAGIPIYEMLAETTGKAGDELSTFIEEGGVTFDVLTKMFDEANNAGGRFFGAFENQQGSFNQTLANMKDSFGLFAADIVEKSGLFDGIILAMQQLTFLMANYESVAASVQLRFTELIAEIDRQTGLITLLKETWANLVFVYQNTLGPALKELWEALQPLKPFLDALIQVFGTMLVIAIGATIMILGTLAIALTGALTAMTEVYTFLVGKLTDGFDWITAKIEASLEPIEKFVSLLKKAVSLIGDLPGDAGGFIGGLFSSATKVNDAVISPEGKVITTHPDDYIIATKTPQTLGMGGGSTVNIYGGTYLSEDVAEQIGDMIMNRLKLSNAM